MIQNISFFNRDINFTHEEVLDLVPILKRMSDRSSAKLKKLNSQLALSNKAEIQESINKELMLWSNQVRMLGGMPVSMGKVRMRGYDDDYLYEHNVNKVWLQ